MPLLFVKSLTVFKESLAAETGLHFRRTAIQFLSLSRDLLCSKARPALSAAQPPTQWAERALSPGLRRRGRKAGRSHLVPSLRMSGGVPPLRSMLS